MGERVNNKKGRGMVELVRVKGYQEMNNRTESSGLKVRLAVQSQEVLVRVKVKPLVYGSCMIKVDADLSQIMKSKPQEQASVKIVQVSGKNAN